MIIYNNITLPMAINGHALLFLEGKPIDFLFPKDDFYTPKPYWYVTGNSTAFSYYQSGSGAVWLYNTNCSGQEARLVDCPHDNSTAFCDHYDDLAVSCQGVCSNDGDLRLVDSRLRPNEGRVMVCIDGHWGTVCGDLWNAKNTQVVCRQVGYYGM